MCNKEQLVHLVLLYAHLFRWIGLASQHDYGAVSLQRQTKILHDKGRAFPECSMWFLNVLNVSNGQSKLCQDKPQKRPQISDTGALLTSYIEMQLRYICFELHHNKI